MFDKILDFIQQYAPQYDNREKIKEFILGHLSYGTCDWEFDKNGEVIFVVRWNIQDKTVKVLDLIINPKYRNIKTIKWILARNLIKHLPEYPQIKFIWWTREIKYPKRKPKVYTIRELLKNK